MLKKIAVVVPCYNEELRLQSNKFIEFARQNTHIDLWFVNDGSTDNTLSLLEDMNLKLPGQIFAVSLEKNGGKADAVRKGILQVAQLPEYQVLGFIDADLSAPLEEINNLSTIFDQYSDAQISAGSRVKILGRTITRGTIRHYCSRIFVTFYSNLLKLPNYDTQCGVKLFSRGVAQPIFNEPFVSKWMFDVEMFLRAIGHLGMDRYLNTVKEVPLSEWREVGGSKLKATDFIKAPAEILRIRKAYIDTIRKINHKK